MYIFQILSAEVLISRLLRIFAGCFHSPAASFQSLVRLYCWKKEIEVRELGTHRSVQQFLPSLALPVAPCARSPCCGAKLPAADRGGLRSLRSLRSCTAHTKPDAKAAERVHPSLLPIIASETIMRRKSQHCSPARSINNSRIHNRIRFQAALLNKVE